MVRRIIKLLLILFWMGLIFSFSNDSGTVSTKKSDGFIIRTVETIIGRELSADEKEKWVNYLVVPVRKGAHLAVYLVLGVLIFSFVSEFMVINYKSLLLSIGISFLYACSDEIHQLLVPGRSGQVKDVILDTLGASIGIVIISFIMKVIEKRKNKLVSDKD